jgi:hypothetical protein
MDIRHIPQTFWYSLSFAIFILSLAFTAAIWRASSISIEVANAKVKLADARADTRVVIAEVTQIAKTLKREREDLASAKATAKEELERQVTLQKQLLEKSTGKKTAELQRELALQKQSLERVTPTFKEAFSKVELEESNLDTAIRELEKIKSSLAESAQKQ